MKKNKLIIVMCLAMASAVAHAQGSLTATVMSPAGDFFSPGTSSLSFTVAEMTAVKTFTSGDNVLNQGFQNTFWIPIVLTVESTSDHAVSIALYPNPSSQWFQISTGSIKDKLNVTLCDALGRVVMNETILPSLPASVKFSIAHLSSGIYSVIVINAKNENQKLFTSKLSIIH